MKRVRLVIWVMAALRVQQTSFSFQYYSESTCELKHVQKAYLHKKGGSYCSV